MNLEENVYPYFRLTSHFNIPFNYECRQQTIIFLIVPVTLSPTERMGFYHITFVADLLKYHLYSSLFQYYKLLDLPLDLLNTHYIITFNILMCCNINCDPICLYLKILFSENISFTKMPKAREFVVQKGLKTPRLVEVYKVKKKVRSQCQLLAIYKI